MQFMSLDPSEGPLCESITFPSHRLWKESASPTATLLQNRNQEHKKRYHMKTKMLQKSKRSTISMKTMLVEKTVDPPAILAPVPASPSLAKCL